VVTRSGALQELRRRGRQRRRSARERARVTIRERPSSSSAPDGAVATRQTADVSLPRTELERLWTAESLERLARTYWRFLERISLGLLRVLYTPHSREVVAVRRPFVLLRFRAPEYDVASDRGAVLWRIDKGLLVVPHGRGKGFLRISVQRGAELPSNPGDEASVTVCSEVSNFYPMIGGSGRFSVIGRQIYRFTQLRIHVIVTNAFLRSLARLDLAPSVVGALSDGAEGAGELPRPGGEA
jgi:hypothetical protein